VEEKTMTGELKAFPLDKVNIAECFPPGFHKSDWYGIYFFNASKNHSNNQDHKPFIAFLNAGFDFVTQHASKHQPGFLVLFNHNFLPKRLNDKLQQLPLFIQQGWGPHELTSQQVPELKLLFNKICSELPSDYLYKKELLATLVTQLMHFVIKNFCREWSPDS
jgi:hypothetical protein